MKHIHFNEGMNTSLLKKLRFKIGEQYELNEFNLKALESTFINGLEYENYEYIKDDFKVLFGVEFSSNVILQYNGDILCSVMYEFEVTHYELLLSKISGFSFNDIIMEVVKKNDTHCMLLVEGI